MTKPKRSSWVAVIVAVTLASTAAIAATMSYTDATTPVLKVTYTGSGSGTAISGQTAVTSNGSIAVFGFNPAPFGTGVSGYGGNTTKLSIGVAGRTDSNAAGSAGVSGTAEPGIGQVYGVFGRTNSTAGYGVFGMASAQGGGTGVFGETFSNSGYGVYGYSSTPGGYGVFSKGKFAATGTKSAIVMTSRGATELFTEEATTVLFTDYGNGRLNQGQARIELDPYFLETVTIDDSHPMMVFVQLEDAAQGVYVKKNTKGFEVIELAKGQSNARFSYRVVAHRKGYEDTRL